MKQLLIYIDNLSPFLQGLLGSIAFAGVLWLSRLALNGAKKTTKSLYRFQSRDILFKHWMHKHFVKSREQYLFTLGHFFVFRESFLWILRAGITIVFFAGVASFLNGSWLSLIGYYLALNFLFEARSWLKDWSDEKEIAFVDKDTKDKFFKEWDDREKQ